jgi:DNA-directed RNA polymerase specialized sigma24 family protein
MSDTAPDKAAFDDQDRADMRRLCAGEDAAPNDLMKRHAPRLVSYLLRSWQNEENAADVAQESFARVYHHRINFNPNQRCSVCLYSELLAQSGGNTSL